MNGWLRLWVLVSSVWAVVVVSAAAFVIQEDTRYQEALYAMREAVNMPGAAPAAVKEVNILAIKKAVDAGDKRSANDFAKHLAYFDSQQSRRNRLYVQSLAWLAIPLLVLLLLGYGIAWVRRGFRS